MMELKKTSKPAGFYKYQNIYQPLKKKPFFFHRWMMRLFFGLKWVKKIQYE